MAEYASVSAEELVETMPWGDTLLATKRKQPPAIAPPGGYDDPPPSSRRVILTIAVQDPYGNIIRDSDGFPHKSRIKAKVNIAGDLLATELAHKRISEEAFAMGRKIEKILRRGQPTGGGQWRQGDRVDAVSAHEHAIACNVDDANAALALRYEIRAAIGLRMGTAVCLVLGNGLSFKGLAKAMAPAGAYHKDANGKPIRQSEGELVRDWTRRQVEYHARLFRDGLEDYTSWATTARGVAKR